jgi:hypothetical protein
MAGVTRAGASPPTSASGTFTYTSCIPNSTRVVGADTIIDFTCTVAYTGTLSGTSTLQGPLIIHADGSTNFHGTETFTGTVNGVPGTVTLNDASLGTSTAFRETNVLLGETGALATVRGVLTSSGTVPAGGIPFGTYAGQIQSGAP